MPPEFGAKAKGHGVRDYSLHSTVAREFDDSGWFVGPTLPYKIREELPVTRAQIPERHPPAARRDDSSAEVGA